jgi:sulfite exporter TauE/SafE
MIELPLVLLGGFLGSTHCVGMCGGFALSIGIGAGNLAQNLTRQLVYSGGRVLTYAFLGVAAGYGGHWLSRQAAGLVNIQACLSLLAGTVLVLQGLSSLGLVAPSGFARGGGAKGAACLAGSVLGPFLTAPGLGRVWIAGILTGFLPCGLVYGFLGLASSTMSLSQGLLIMGAFGIGTAPLMMATGVAGSLLSRSVRVRLLRVAGICVLLTGLISLARGAAFLDLTGSDVPSSCPLCAGSVEPSPFP